MTRPSFPASPEQVTDEWLTSALRQADAAREARVVSHTATLVEAQGAAGVVARLELEYDRAEAEAPRSVVAKFASPHDPIRALMHGLGAYTREVEFYRHFGADPGIPTPRCFHADIDSASGSFALLLEDMSDSRIAEGPTASPEDIEVAVRHLAPFHAKWWNHQRLRDLEFLHYPGSDGDLAFMALARSALTAALPAATQRFGTQLPATLVALAERVLANFDTLMEMRSSQYHDRVTLVHGDYHPGQIFFESKRGGRFAVFECQMVSAGGGGDDLARIIATGLSADQRPALEGPLVRLYHSLLVEHGVAGYTIETCWEDFRVGLLASAVMNLIAGAVIEPALMGESRDVGVTDVLFRRMAAAIEAHGVLEMVFG